LFGIRAKLIYSFALFFAMNVFISLWSIYELGHLEEKVNYLEIANDFMLEIQQARRYEKDFLLYGTNLEDTYTHLEIARSIIKNNAKTIAKILGQDHFKTKVDYMTRYYNQVALLGSRNDDTEANLKILRELGRQMISFAAELQKKERREVNHLFSVYQKAPFLFLGALLILMLLILMTFMRQLIQTLNRFLAYTKRIGEGDFSPIFQPKGRHDEFHRLAEAFNQMVKELDHRHNVLAESDKLRAIGTLVAGVAHELNNPLNNSLLTASVLKEDFNDFSDKEKIEMVEDLIHETERSQKIVRGLLDFARESESEVKPLNLEKIIDDSIHLVHNQIRMSKVFLTTVKKIDLPPVHGDEQLLKQVFVNLMINAIDALSPKGRIEVSLHKNLNPGYVSVKISDNGPGIPDHIKSRVFEPFFTTKEKGKGTGLGLSVSRGIIRKMGGAIFLDDKQGIGADFGTTFTIELPITQRPSRIMSTDRRQTE